MRRAEQSDRPRARRWRPRAGAEPCIGRDRRRSTRGRGPRALARGEGSPHGEGTGGHQMALLRGAAGPQNACGVGDTEPPSTVAATRGTGVVSCSREGRAEVRGPDCVVTGRRALRRAPGPAGPPAECACAWGPVRQCPRCLAGKCIHAQMRLRGKSSARA